MSSIGYGAMRSKIAVAKTYKDYGISGVVMINLVSYGTSSYAITQNNLKNLLSNTGQATNSTGNNPAGSAQSSSYNVQLSSAAQALNTMASGTSLLNNLQNINFVSLQPNNGIINPNSHSIIQSQVSQLNQDINQTAATAELNGLNLLSGNTNGTLPTGLNPIQTAEMSLGNLSGTALELSEINLATTEEQVTPFSLMTNAFHGIINQNPIIDANAAIVRSTLSNQNAFYNNLTATNSGISDTPYATRLTTNLSQNNTLSNAASKAISIYKLVQGS